MLDAVNSFRFHPPTNVSSLPSPHLPHPPSFYADKDSRRTPLYFRAFMSSQQCSGRASYSTHTPQARMAREGNVVKTSFINHENTMGEFKFPVGKREEVKELSTRVVRTKAVDPVTGNIEDWIGVNFQSCYDDIGMQKCGRPPIELVLVLDISGSMCKLLFLKKMPLSSPLPICGVSKKTKTNHTFYPSLFLP